MQTGSLPSWPLDEYRELMERSTGVQARLTGLRLTRLEDQHLSDRPTPQKHTYPVVKELTTQLVGTAGFEPA